MPAYITYRENGTATVRFDIEDDQEFTQALTFFKQYVAEDQRQWSRSKKIWTLAPGWGERAEVACEMALDPGEVVVDRSVLLDAPEKGTNILPIPDPYVVLHLLPSAPPTVIDAAFRALSKLPHQNIAVLRDAYESLRPRRRSS